MFQIALPERGPVPNEKEKSAEGSCADDDIGVVQQVKGRRCDLDGAEERLEGMDVGWVFGVLGHWVIAPLGVDVDFSRVRGECGRTTYDVYQPCTTDCSRKPSHIDYLVNVNNE